MKTETITELNAAKVWWENKFPKEKNELIKSNNISQSTYWKISDHALKHIYRKEVIIPWAKSFYGEGYVALLENSLFGFYQSEVLNKETEVKKLSAYECYKMKADMCDEEFKKLLTDNGIIIKKCPFPNGYTKLASCCKTEADCGKIQELAYSKPKKDMVKYYGNFENIPTETGEVKKSANEEAKTAEEMLKEFPYFISNPEPFVSLLNDFAAQQTNNIFPKELHPDSKALLQSCLTELALKMVKNQEKYGYSNEWLTEDWKDECQQNLLHHLAKGDPRDVAIYAMFMMRRGWETKLKL